MSITTRTLDPYSTPIYIHTVRPAYSWKNFLEYNQCEFQFSSEYFKEFLTYKNLFYDTDIRVNTETKQDSTFLNFSTPNEEWINACNGVYHKLSYQEAILLINYRTLFNDLYQLESAPQIPNFYPFVLDTPPLVGWYRIDIIEIHNLAWKQVFKKWKKQPVDWIHQTLHRYLEPQSPPLQSSLVFMNLYQSVIMDEERPVDAYYERLFLNTKGQKFFIPYLANALDIWFPVPLIFILLEYIQKYIKQKKVQELFAPESRKVFDYKSFQNEFKKLSESPAKQYQLFTREAIVFFDFSQHWIKLAREYNKKLQLLFLKFPPLPEPLIVYRGVKEVASFYPYPEWKGFSSTTLDPNIAMGYINQQDQQNQLCCMLEIRIPAGMKVLPIFSMKSRDRGVLFEVLLPDKTKVVWNQEEIRQIMKFPSYPPQYFPITTFKIDVEPNFRMNL